MNQPSLKSLTLEWRPEKRLQSQDRLWVLTDTYTEWRSFRDYATPQKFFRVGCYDLRTGKICFVRFSVDDVRGFLKAGVPPAPWPGGLSSGIEVKRLAHGEGEEKGRFKVDVTLVDIPSDLAWVGPVARAAFKKEDHRSNSSLGMWRKMADRVAQEKAIEKAALDMKGSFSAGDVKNEVKKVLGREVAVSATLKRLVEEKQLLPFGKKRGRTYEVTPRMVVERVDWTS